MSDSAARVPSDRLLITPSGSVSLLGRRGCSVLTRVHPTPKPRLHEIDMNGTTSSPPRQWHSHNLYAPDAGFHPAPPHYPDPDLAYSRDRPPFYPDFHYAKALATPPMAGAYARPVGNSSARPARHGGNRKTDDFRSHGPAWPRLSAVSWGILAVALSAWAFYGVLVFFG